MNIFLNVAFICFIDRLEIISLEVPEVKLHRKDCDDLEPSLTKGKCRWILVAIDSN